MSSPMNWPNSLAEISPRPLKRKSRHSRPLLGQEFFVTEGFEHVKVGLFSVQDAFDAAFAHDVLNLSATESVVGSNGFGVFDLLDLRKHVLPDFQPGVGIGGGEPDLEQETTLEGRVEVVGEVGGGDEDAVETLHLLEDDVLHGVFHPFRRVADTGEPVA